MPPRERRIKLLFVITQLVQGGSERYLFELCRALDPNRFDVEILFRRRPRKHDYYYWKLKALGFKIHTKLPLRRNFARFFPRLAKSAAWLRVEDATYSMMYALTLRDFFARYDLINILQIEHFYSLRPFLREQDKEIVYLLSSAFQYGTDPYARCAPDHFHRFVIMDPDQLRDLEQCGVALKYEAVYMPLSMDFSEHPQLSPAQPVDDVVHAGVFIRLSAERAIEPLFECFAAVTRRRAATLHVYGTGDPGMFTDVLKELGILEHVIFEGHQPDIPAAIVRDKIGLVIMTSHDAVLGYASIEIAATATPMLFWNLGTENTHDVANATGGAIQTFLDPNAFAEAAVALTSAPAALAEHGNRLSAHVRTTRDIRSNIGLLEEYMIRISAANAIAR